MAQTLNITFNGLCLFVPGDGRMYVLMPKTGPAAGDGSVEQHTATLSYGGAAVEGGTGGTVAIEGVEIAFGGADGGGVDTSFPSGVVNLSRYTGAGIPSGYLTGDGAPVAARIVLGAGGFGTVGDVACWTFLRRVDGRDVEERAEMTNNATWTVPVDGGPVTVRKRPLAGGADQEVVRFRTDVPSIDLRIACAVDHDHATVPKVGDPPHHFRAFYWLLDDPADTRLPGFTNEGHCNGGGVLAHGGSPFNCIVAGAFIQPPPP